MDNKELITLIEQGRRDEAIKIVKDFYNVSLEESNEYVDSLMSKKDINKKNKKTNDYLMALIPIIVIIILLPIGMHISNQTSEFKQHYESLNKDVYGPKDYKDAYLKIVYDTLLNQNEKVDLYIELRNEENAGVPFKETRYWKNYKLK